MSISEHLTQQKLQEILMNAYLKGTENKNLKVIELVEELKQQVAAAIDSSK